MTRTIALFNQAGGVCKTTLTQNLGYHLSQRGNRVLLIDMDPQSSLTTFMGFVPEELEKTVADALVDEEPLFILDKIHGMDLAPTNDQLSGAEMELVNVDMREQRLKDAIEPVSEHYDFILIDCPASLGLLSFISLVAATHVLVPLETQYKSFEGTDKLLATLARVKKKANRNLQIAGFVPTKHANNISQNIRTLAAINEQLSTIGKVYPPIPRTTVFADASEKSLPLALYSPKHACLSILDLIATELEKLT